MLILLLILSLINFMYSTYLINDTWKSWEILIYIIIQLYSCVNILIIIINIMYLH